MSPKISASFKAQGSSTRGQSLCCTEAGVRCELERG